MKYVSTKPNTSDVKPGTHKIRRNKMLTYAMDTTEKEIEKNYIDLRRMLNTGKAVEAMKLAINLAKGDDTRLWKFLREYISADIKYKETTPLLVVNALYQGWLADPNEPFLVQAILTLTGAPKTDSALNFYERYK
jgi:hypothetical protein